MSLKDADSLTPQVQLANILNKLAPSDYITDRLIIASPTYMKNLTQILSSTSRETLQTYLIWKVVQAFASEIEADEIKPYTRFSNKLQGKVTISRLSMHYSLLTHPGSRLFSRAVENLRWPC